MAVSDHADDRAARSFRPEDPSRMDESIQGEHPYLKTDLVSWNCLQLLLRASMSTKAASPREFNFAQNHDISTSNPKRMAQVAAKVAYILYYIGIATIRPILRQRHI